MSTNDAFEHFLLGLEPHLSSTEERYLSLRARLVKFFEWRRCEDPEGLSDETIGRLVKNILAGDRIEKPSSYVYGVALNVYREQVRRETKIRQAQVESQQSSSNEHDLFLECAKHCFEKLPDDLRALLERYYTDADGRHELAESMEITFASLRTKIHRIRVDVKDCFRRCIMGYR